MIDALRLSRFASDLDALVAPGARVGLAVSGGPDSMALLLLAAAARPGLVLAGSVDHGLRAGSRAEAVAVARWCAAHAVPHQILTIDWPTPPTSAVQERARDARYRALGAWAKAEGLGAIATGHHADDQAETLIMRLVRGAGVRGLAAMRPSARLPGTDDLALIRPLLGWRRAELAAVVAASGVEAAADPSNLDERHERVRIRQRMAANAWLDPAALAASAAHLADADEAIDHAVKSEWQRVRRDGNSLRYEPRDVPTEIRRRLATQMIAALASEGDGEVLRGRELDALLAKLGDGAAATLRGVLAQGGPVWTFRRAPPRR